MKSCDHYSSYGNLHLVTMKKNAYHVWLENKQLTTRSLKPRKANIELLHVDLCGPMEEMSRSGSKYGMPLVEDSEGLIIGHVLKQKSDAEENIRNTILWFENQFNIKVKILRADRGGEFVSTKFKEWCQSRGIEQQFSHTGESKENGVAERAHRTLLNSVRTMLDASGLDKSFWAEAFKFAVYNQNAVVHKRTGNIP